MRIDVHIHLPPDSFIVTKLNEIVTLLNQSKQREQAMAGELDGLATEVGDIKTVAESAATLLDGIHARLDEAIASGDPNRVIALRDDLALTKGNLAAAVERNTVSPA